MRPTGVVLIAIYHYVGAAFLVVAAIAMVVGGTLVGSLIGREVNTPMGAGMGFAIGIFAALFCLVFAAIAATAGYGLWSLKEWGRILCIVLAVIALVLSLPSLFAMTLHFGFFLGGFHLLRIAIEVLIIWYLMQPQVRALFQRAPLPAGPMA
jgi:hypothetical protein